MRADARPSRSELVLNRTWRPLLAVTGADGLPPPANAGNVLRPKTQLVLSLRLPPTVDGRQRRPAAEGLLEADPPYGAKRALRVRPGRHRLARAADRALAGRVRSTPPRRTHFGKPAMWMGEGGTIPFMAMLGAKFPQAQFLITGVLGPHSNAHGPNEFLHIDYAKRLTACVADVLAAHAAK